MAFPIRLTGRHAGPQVMRAMVSGLIPHAFVPELWYRQRITLADITPAAATSQELDLNALFPKNTFPTGVDLMEGALGRVVALTAGTAISAATFELGDTGDPNGLLTAVSCLGGGAAAGDIYNTPAAAQYARRPETAFVPTVTVRLTGGNMTALTTLDIEVLIPWSPRTQVV